MKAITLRRHGNEAFPFENCFFTFESGRFCYDCAACGAECCRGHSFRLQTAKELRMILQRHAAAHLFIEPTGLSDQYIVNNLPPACFFLRPDQLCELHAADGFDAKPEECRFFPFNYFRRVAQYLVVAPHFGLCPLRIAAQDSTCDVSAHDALFDSLAEHGVWSDVPAVTPLTMDGAALIALEKRICARAESMAWSATYTEFANAQLEETLTVKAAGQPNRTSSWWDAWSGSVRLVLGQECSGVNHHDAALAATLIAITPTLRSHMVFVNPRYPVRAAGIDLVDVPKVLLALYLVARSARVLSHEDLTYQSLVRLYSSNWRLLCLLSRLDDVVTVEGSVTGEGGTLDRHSTVSAILCDLSPARQSSRPTVLGEILLRHLAHCAGLERLTTLRMVSTKVIAGLATSAAAAPA